MDDQLRLFVRVIPAPLHILRRRRQKVMARRARYMRVRFRPGCRSPVERKCKGEDQREGCQIAACRSHGSLPGAWSSACAYEDKASLAPAARVLRKARTLHPHDAEALTRGRLHHHPALEAPHHGGAELLEPRYFGRDVVTLDVDVDATLVVHALKLDYRLVILGLEHPVVAAARRVLEVHGATQRLAPEARGGVDVRGVAVDQHGAETGAVHGDFLSSRRATG